jgi:hypothetical protein
MFISKTIAGVHCAALTLGALGLAGCGGAVESEPTNTGTESQALSHGHSDVPPLPNPALAVPAGNELAFHYDAVGVQIYTCKATATGFGWVFVAPDATLYAKGKIVGTHYAGPTWESKDGSKVVGSRIAGATPDPTSIPWLLLGVVSHAGDGKMSEVTYIQRLETSGGLAPSSGCDATAAGVSARVPYTATYYFYEADGDDERGDD